MAGVGQTAVLLVAGLIVLRGMAGQGGYDAFLRGAEQGARTAARLIPAVTAMSLMLGIMVSGGLSDGLIAWLSPLLRLVGLPPEVAPVLVLRPLTGSGSMAALQAVFEQCGVDSRAGRIASVLMGTSETIFYTLTVYLGATDVRRLPYVVPISMASYFTGAVVAGLIF